MRFNTGVMLLFFLFNFQNLYRSSKSFGKHPEIGSEENAVSPASFLTPEATEVVAYSIVGSLCEATVFAFTEFIVALSNLPDYFSLSNRRNGPSRITYHAYQPGQPLPIPIP